MDDTDRPVAMDTGEGSQANGSVKKKVYLPGISRPLKGSEELVCDKSAYKFLKPFQCENPCLSFDVVPDTLGATRDGYPVCSTIVCGTQAENVRDNGILLMKVSNIHKRKQRSEDDKDEEESSSSEEEEGNGGSQTNGREPLLVAAKIPHHGGVNRIRSTQLGTASVCAAWNDQGKVQLWNLGDAQKAVEELGDGKQKQSIVLKNQKPLFSFAGHQTEGFALDWSPIAPGKLASGDNRKRIHVWCMKEGGEWLVDQRPFAAHKGSVEDIQWSPSEDNVFASCSSDATIRLWDARSPPGEACACTVEKAHDGDVNVISWNRADPFLLSGGDDGVLKIWDLKTIQYKIPVVVFKHHKKPITAVQWYPHDSTVFGASGEDDQVTIWDIAMEPDQVVQNGESNEQSEDNVPSQLMFVHSGQEHIKELRWHPQVVGTLTTSAQDGFNIFRTVNM